jgi:hypothetical protein
MLVSSDFLVKQTSGMKSDALNSFNDPSTHEEFLSNIEHFERNILRPATREE